MVWFFVMNIPMFMVMNVEGWNFKQAARNYILSPEKMEKLSRMHYKMLSGTILLMSPIIINQRWSPLQIARKRVLFILLMKSLLFNKLLKNII